MSVGHFGPGNQWVVDASPDQAPAAPAQVLLMPDGTFSAAGVPVSVGGATPRVLAVGSRGVIAGSQDSTNKYCNNVRGHQIFYAQSRLALVVGNVAVQGGNPQIAPGAPTSVTASIEYPAGTFTQIKFGGAVMGTIADGVPLQSDFSAISVPEGARVWSHIWMHCANGLMYQPVGSQPNGGLGDAAQTSATALPDQTMTGGTPYASGNIYGPLAVIGDSPGDAVFIGGDSLAMGTGDTTDGLGHVGIIERAIGPSMASSRFGSSGSQINNFANSFFLAPTTTQPLGFMLKYFNKFLFQFGTNDFALGSRTSSQALADVGTVMGMLPANSEMYVCTPPPRSTSTDTFATPTYLVPATNNQTVATGQAQKAAYIAALTSISAPLGLTGVIDQTTCLEFSPKSGYWKAPACTPDGVHPADSYYLLASQQINPAVIRRSTVWR